MTDWEFRSLNIEHHGTGAQVFTCEVLLKASGRVSRRWLNVDGVLLVDGKLMLNKADALHQAALHAGLDPAAVASELRAWVSTQINAPVALVATAGAD